MKNKKDKESSSSGTSPETPSSAVIFEQIHKSFRHAFHLFVGWFTFFFTLNFVVLGWLAKVGDDNPDPNIVGQIAYALIIFIVLGFISGVTIIVHVWRSRARLVDQLKTFENAKVIVNASFPADLYTVNVILMTIALFILLRIWVNFL